MTEELRRALQLMLDGDNALEVQQRRVIVYDLLWKLARKDYHGVADCAMDLRELHL